MHEIKFGKFWYNLPTSNDEAEQFAHTAGCIGLNEAYEGIGWVGEQEFYDAAKQLHRQMATIREQLVMANFTDANINFVIGELLEIQNWLKNQKFQKL